MRPPKTRKAAEWLRRSPVRRIVATTKHRGLSASDVLLASYPRSGNGWAMLMLTELLTGERVDWSAGPEPPSIIGSERVASMIGAHRDAPRVLSGGGRLIKTHEPYRREYRRAIYLVRDVRDVAASVFRLREYEGMSTQTWEHFLDDFAIGRIGGWGSWQSHVDGWCAASGRAADVLIIHYEDMVDAPARALGRMAHFVGLNADGDRLQVVADNHVPQEVRSRSGHSARVLSLLMANATYGRWREVYTPEQLSKLGPAMDVMRRMGYEVDEPFALSP